MSPRSPVHCDLCKLSKSDVYDIGRNINSNFPLHKVKLNNLYWHPYIAQQWVIQNDIDYHREERYRRDYLYQEEIWKSQHYQRRLSIILSAIRDAIADCQRWQEQAKTGKGKAVQKSVSGLPPT